MSVMRVGLGTSATSQTEIFMTIIKEWKLSRAVKNRSILHTTVVLDPI